MPEINKNNWISNLRVIATLSVIVLHVSAELLLSSFTNPPNIFWNVANLYDSLVRYCVPIFVMITGALMLPQEIELTAFFQKRFKRVLIPFLFWSLIYIFNSFLSDLHIGKTFTPLSAIKTICNSFLFGASYHLWYIYMLIGLYLFIPILSKWIRNCSEKEIVYFLVVWAFTVTIGRINHFSNIRPLYFTGYIGYLVLGYYLANKNFKQTKKQVSFYALILILVGALSTGALTYIASVKKGMFYEEFYNNFNPNVMMVAIGVFVLLKFQTPVRNETLLKVTSTIDQYSYGIYLVHVLVLLYLNKIGINGRFIHPIVGIPITSIICLGFSTLIVYLFRKLPLGKFISG
jgi:surface polysaccharide O-acyltransferase-like enzyme